MTNALALEYNKNIHEMCKTYTLLYAR